MRFDLRHLCFFLLSACLFAGGAAAQDVESMTAPGGGRSTLGPQTTAVSPSSTPSTPKEAPRSGGANDVLDQLMRRRSESMPDGVDQDRARDAERRGVVLRYSAILAIIRQESPGGYRQRGLREISKDRWRYEFKILGFDGRYTEATLDARSGAICARFSADAGADCRRRAEDRGQHRR